MYEAITKYIGKLADWGEKYIPSESSCHIPVVSYTQATDDFRKDMRAFMPKDYIAELDKIKTKLNIEQFRTDLDISTLTAEEIIALITGVIRRERFCEGILGTFIKEGAIDKWLVRLKELDEKGTSAMSENENKKKGRDKIIRIFWNEKIPIDEAIASDLSNTQGLYYITRVFGEKETSLYVGIATSHNIIRRRLKAHKSWWLKSYRGQIYVRIGEIVYPRNYAKETIEDAESAILFDQSHKDLFPENVAKRSSYHYTELYRVENIGDIFELSESIRMYDHE
ncbi:MAG: hypothetical protein IJC83_05495 [Oscillospiraceae bacterium]|nr:hypothetical protein [Oscillospiraceae bacterium]